MKTETFMTNSRTTQCVRMLMILLPAFTILNLQQANAAADSDEIVAVDLLTAKEPESPTESRLRVIRLTTRSGAKGYGDYLDFDFPARNEQETLDRLVNRYAQQNHKNCLLYTSPSPRDLSTSRMPSSA